jgi:hypothetical protein
MKSIWAPSGSHSKRPGLFVAVMLSLFLFAPRAASKISTDFDPNLDFSQLKTFAFIGGVEQLVRCNSIQTSLTIASIAPSLVS